MRVQLRGSVPVRGVSACVLRAVCFAQFCFVVYHRAVLLLWCYRSCPRSKFRNCLRDKTANTKHQKSALQSVLRRMQLALFMRIAELGASHVCLVVQNEAYSAPALQRWEGLCLNTTTMHGSPPLPSPPLRSS